MSAAGGQSGWPTTPGGLGGGSWEAVEAMVAGLLAGLADPGPPVAGEGFLLFYLPFTDLGRAEGVAWCWEVMLSRGGSEVSDVGVGEDPVEALGEVLTAVGPPWSRKRPGSSGEQGRRAAAEELQRGRAGWSAALRQAAVVAAAGPASGDGPSVAGFDLEVVWESGPGGGRWAWRAGGMQVLDAAGETTGERWWEGDAPGAALAQAPTWFHPDPDPDPDLGPGPDSDVGPDAEGAAR